MHIETTDKGRRYNEGKPKFSLIKLSCLIPLADRLERGAHKYSEYFHTESGFIAKGSELPYDKFDKIKWIKKYDGTDNWDKGLKLNEVLDSMLRHISALRDGETNDEDGSHIGAIQANAMFLGSKNLIK